MLMITRPSLASSWFRKSLARKACSTGNERVALTEAAQVPLLEGNSKLFTQLEVRSYKRLYEDGAMIVE